MMLSLMPVSPQHPDGLGELFRVAVIGSAGWLTAFTLADAATVVSICVGVATLVYVAAKTYFLIKHDGGGPK